MDTYTSLKEELLTINQEIHTLFSRAEQIPGVTAHPFTDWEETSNTINQQIKEEIIRVAVVGPIKSGKSSYINALFKGDFLKRGAGVVTSIVTRACTGENLRARLLFKSWDEVNAEIRQATVLFPSFSQRLENKEFDIRRRQDREDLQQALVALSTEQLINKGSRSVGSVLLSSYLKGYTRVKDIISSDEVVREYEDDRFIEHQDFVSNESLATYLKDIQLEINSGRFDSSIEIADCQGSDSPNPLHIAMIQDYLLLTHLIVYIISSRTGLREADIKFLSMIRKMGIMDNILFVVNCDFSEHESLSDLKALLKKIEEEISLIKADPKVFSFSVLFNLFKEQRQNLSSKDKLRLDQWEREKELTKFSDRETQRFELFLDNKLTRDRYALLLLNHLERLDVIARGIDHWIAINQNILAKDASGAKEVAEKIKHHQESMNRIKSIIKSTLDGAIQKIEKKLKTDIDRFFDVRSDSALKEAVEFIRNYQLSPHDYQESLKASGFSNTLYIIFQDFKHALDTYMTETVNPEIIRFVRQQEALIREHLVSTAEPYEVMVRDALVEYNSLMESFGISSIQTNQPGIELPDMDSIKSVAGLSLPPAVASLRYSAKIKTEAVMRLGFYAVVKLFKRLFKKPIQIQNEEEIRAIKYGILRIKRETERSIIFLFKDYRENIKFQYLFKLVGAVSNKLYEVILERFQTYLTDLSSVVELVGDQRLDKQRTSDLLRKMESTVKEISPKIKIVRDTIDSTVTTREVLENLTVTDELA